MYKNYLFESIEEPVNLKDLVNKLEINIKGKENEIFRHIATLVSQLYQAALQSTDGYCMKFHVPLGGISSLFKMLDLVVSTVEAAFRADWQYPKNTKMYSDIIIR